MSVFDIANVLKIIDADTIDVAIHLSNHMLGIDLASKQRLRLARINAPEMSTPEGKAARDVVAAMLPAGTAVRLVIHGKDRYGRLIAEVTMPDGRNLSNVLLSENRAEPYSLAMMLVDQ